MAIPTDYTDFAVAIATKSLTNEDLIAFSLMHAHTDFESTQACEICSTILEGTNQLIFNFIVETFSDSLSEQMIKFLYEKSEIYHSNFNAYTSYWQIKTDLCLLTNTPAEIFAEFFDNVDCQANQGDLWVHSDWESYFKRLVKHPFGTEEHLAKFRSVVHGRIEMCTCAAPAICEMCKGHLQD